MGLGTTEQERMVLGQLSLLGASFPEMQQPTELDRLMVAQHFGLKTRLLDWTSNPLVVLWFACQDRQTGDAFVYALEADTLQKEGLYSRDPFKVDVTRAFQPRLNNPRILAQHGWFTLHRFSQRSKAFVPLDTNPTTVKHLTEIRIPAKRRSLILDSLYRHGISRRTLFPDTECLCTFMSWRYKLA